jgi:hypothetical protein
MKINFDCERKLTKDEKEVEGEMEKFEQFGKNGKSISN